MKEVRKTDVYYKSIIYTLENKFDKIDEFEFNY